MKKITLLAAAFAVTFGMSGQIFYDGFETYDDFAIDNIGSWTQHDLDGGTTWGDNTYNFTNEGYVGTAIIFNPSMTAPSAAGSNYDAFNGSKGLYFFAAGASGTTFPNDDWFISPQISLQAVSGANLSLYAKAITDQFGPDLFEIGVSTTGTNPSDFTIITTSPINPTTTWEEYTFDLTAYDGQDVYIAIHCVTNDGFVLQIDDFTVNEALSIADEHIIGFNYFYSPQTKDLTISAKDTFSNISIFNILGQEVISQQLSNTKEIVNLSSLKDGVYITNVTANGQTTTFKLIKR